MTTTRCIILPKTYQLLTLQSPANKEVNTVLSFVKFILRYLFIFFPYAVSICHCSPCIDSNSLSLGVFNCHGVIVSMLIYLVDVRCLAWYNVRWNVSCWSGISGIIGIIWWRFRSGNQGGGSGCGRYCMGKVKVSSITEPMTSLYPCMYLLMRKIVGHTESSFLGYVMLRFTLAQDSITKANCNWCNS